MSDSLLLSVRRLFAVFGLALLPQLTAAGLASAAQTQTFTPEGGVYQSYAVPAEATELKIVAIGGAGNAGECYAPGPGGSGAKVTAVISVRERQRLYVQFGGGARGGASCSGVGGGEGGGASDVREQPYSSAAGSWSPAAAVAEEER